MTSELRVFNCSLPTDYWFIPVNRLLVLTCWYLGGLTYTICIKPCWQAGVLMVFLISTFIKTSLVEGNFVGECVDGRLFCLLLFPRSQMIIASLHVMRKYYWSRDRIDLSLWRHWFCIGAPHGNKHKICDVIMTSRSYHVTNNTSSLHVEKQ